MEKEIKRHRKCKVPMASFFKRPIVQYNINWWWLLQHVCVCSACKREPMLGACGVEMRETQVRQENIINQPLYSSDSCSNLICGRNVSLMWSIL